MRLLPLLLLPVLAVTAGCAVPTAAAQPVDGRLRVVATTTQVADFVRTVGGDRARVTQLLQPNIDPHDYEASPADVQALADARVLVTNGVGLEAGWLDPVTRAAGFSGTTVDTSRGIAVRRDSGGAPDPHVWHDPRNAERMVATIAQALALADPAGAGGYRARAAAYTVRLRALDADIAGRIGTLPPQDRQLVTNHDAFGYYVDRYGLRFVGSVVPSFDSSAALTGTRLRALAAAIKATGTRAVFSESSLPPDAARALAHQAGVRVEAGEDSLYGDTLGPAGSAGATYLAMERHNTDTIVRALS